MPLDQQATAKDWSIFPYFIHIFLYRWIFTINAPCLKVKYHFFSFYYWFYPAWQRTAMLDKICLFIYLHFFAVLSSQRRKTFLFLSNSLAAITSAEKKGAQIKSHSVLAVGDLGTGLVFSAAWRLCVPVHCCSTKISLLPKYFVRDTRKTEF